ncbi:AAA family ATPase [Aliarcobacter butzleri]|uniref:AAA family ATPase n=1 Tax=Aliarcobacter butzleri TaxID=28197 RepID=UPI001EDD66FE|nr:AAA family ATPase [Aliarcobacter butzleri]MCG3669074.1 AAA family ATPase [Aliarcobacter butzleri]
MKIKIKNFRSFNDMDYIDIKPITILIGRNSSGKSSFLRTFPMLKQSFEERTRSPILLYGNYIDFGSYQDIKPNFIENNENDNYELGFIFDKNIFEDINRYLFRGDFRKREMVEYSESEVFDIGFNVIFEEDKKNLLHIKELKYSLGENTITLNLNHSKNELLNLSINNKKILVNDNSIKFMDRGDFVLDFFYSNAEKRISLEKYISEKIKIFTENLMEEFSEKKSQDNSDPGKLKEFISSVLGLNEDEISKYINTMSSKEFEMISKIRRNHDNDEDKIEKKVIQIQSIKILENNLILDKLQNEIFKSLNLKWTKKSSKFIEIKNLIILYNFIDKFMSPISNYFKQTFLNVKYIAPLRATAERFYRIQHLSVNEVDQNGTNLPSFLDSLTDNQIKEFQNWTKENFNFFVKISKLGGHYSIKISLKDGIDINLSDMGFGYSQILPILTQLWYSSTRYDRNRRIGFSNIQKIIVIEQPELHLHPEFQAKFTNMLAEVLKYAKGNKIDLKIIIETHSDILINRLGDLIIDEKIDAEQINIVIFDKESEEQPTNISLAKYNKDGNLINWPLGFFQPCI